MPVPLKDSVLDIVSYLEHLVLPWAVISLLNGSPRHEISIPFVYPNLPFRQVARGSFPSSKTIPNPKSTTPKSHSPPAISKTIHPLLKPNPDGQRTLDMFVLEDFGGVFGLVRALNCPSN